jgi:hypothetical protein
MPGVLVGPKGINRFKVQGSKNASLAATRDAIVTAVQNALDGTDGTHVRYAVVVEIKPMQV